MIPAKPELLFLKLLISLVFLFSCKGNNSEPPVKEPGEKESTNTRVLEKGSAILQSKEPINALNIYMDGFHFYNGLLGAQMEAHHYCSKLNEDLTQCVIYDGNGKDAHIMGVEYVISERIFKSLPEDEKLLWHSHNYEVKSGELIAPGLPDLAEHEFMEKMVSTYGKTWHTWHTDMNKDLPYGSPQLMMGFIKDGQIDTSMLKKRDEAFGISSNDKRKNREDIPEHKVLSGADAWKNGKIKQLPSLSKSKHP